jgi:hypothetical protein
MTSQSFFGIQSQQRVANLGKQIGDFVSSEVKRDVVVEIRYSGCWAKGRIIRCAGGQAGAGWRVG